MKTIKTILRDLLTLRSKPKNSSGEISQNLKPNQNETETDESARDPQLDNPDARQDPPVGEECSEKPEGTGESGPGPESGRESGPDRRDIEAEIRKAYEEGVIAGRNQKIEEIYFPKTDGIPDFHSSIANDASAGSIFSMAREA